MPDPKDKDQPPVPASAPRHPGGGGSPPQATAPDPAPAPASRAPRSESAPARTPVVALAPADEVARRLVAAGLAVPAAEDRPAEATTETVPGGKYIADAVFTNNRYMGGRIVNANGETLATFEPNQENTGNVEDGKKPAGAR